MSDLMTYVNNAWGGVNDLNPLTPKELWRTSRGVNIDDGWWLMNLTL
jgi:hypothetical protein